MKRILPFLLLCCLSPVFNSCAHVTEFGKVIWGSSTKALEEARSDAIRKTYQCGFEDCFNAVLALTEKKYEPPAVNGNILGGEEVSETPDENAPIQTVFELFIKNRERKHIVVMGVPGSIETTEVGIFFEPVDENNTLVEISSLSTNAKTNVSEIVFKDLSDQYLEAQ